MNIANKLNQDSAKFRNKVVTIRNMESPAGNNVYKK